MIDTLGEFPGWHHVRQINEQRVEAGSEYYGESYQDVQIRQPDITLARTLLAWEPTVAMHEGLRKTITYYLERDFWQSSRLPISQSVFST